MTLPPFPERHRILPVSSRATLARALRSTRLGLLLLILAAFAPAQGLSPQELRDLTIDELLALARDVRRKAEPELLQLPGEATRDPATLERPVREGRCRLLPGDLYLHAVETRGGGSFISFATGSQSYDQEPNLQLTADLSFATGFYGSATGLIYDLGPRPSLQQSRSKRISKPAGVPSGLWSLLRRPVKEIDPEASLKLKDLRRRAESQGATTRVPATPGHVYLLRSVSPGEHDLLALFRCDFRDVHGHLVSWRVLESLKVPAEGLRRIAAPPPLIGEAPARLRSRVQRMSLDDLLTSGQRLRDLIHARLLRVPKHIRRRYRQSGEGDGIKLARIVRRTRYTQVTFGGEGGPCYFSFATEKNLYDEEPDLELISRIRRKRDRSSPTDVPGFEETLLYSTGFYGGTTGFLHDLGPVDLASLSRHAQQPVPGVAPEVWRFFFRDARTTERSYDRSIDREAKTLGIDDDAKAVVGHTYLLRAILPGEHDHLVAFTLVEDDGHGHTLAWRILRRW